MNGTPKTLSPRRVILGLFYGSTVMAAVVVMAGTTCPITPLPIGGYNNTTDKTNNNASYVGSTVCSTCHGQRDPAIIQAHAIHGHSHKLNRVQGGPPTYPAQGINAGVPNPPDGFSWADISYVIGGYTKKGRFIDKDGYILTTGLTGKKTQWNLKLPFIGKDPEFVNYEAAATTKKPYDFACFECHTTGPKKQDAANPMFQENRPGFAGTWEEAGVQCEACHGPGSNHIPNPAARMQFVDPIGAQTCKVCHNRPVNSDTGEILASGGFIQHHEQWPELKASGGHKDFACTICHDPHHSVIYDRANGLRNRCTNCHNTKNMALHEGKVFTRGDYSEPLTCESCHMPFATKSAAQADASVVGAIGRMGDTRTHIFRISIEATDFNSFFTADAKQVVRDAQGRAAVTVDFVCLRCHNDNGAFAMTVAQAADKVQGLHRVLSTNAREVATATAP